MDGSKAARGSLLKKIGDFLPTAANQSKIGLVGILSYGFPVAKWNFQNAENVRVESVNRHRAYFSLVRLFQTLKNAAKV